MNLGITITSTVLVLLVVTPVVLMQQQQKNKERKLIKALKAFAELNNSSITEYDVFKNFAIGLDKNKNNLFFYKNNASKENSQCINLNEIKSCGVLNSKKPTKKNTLGDISRLELVLNPVKNSIDKHTLEIYNETEDFQLNGELEFIRKWEHIINNSLT